MPDHKGNRTKQEDGIPSGLAPLPSPAKHLGQHFLTDPGIARKIVGSLDPGLLATLPVLEIGPGRMILTKILADRTSHLVLIEKDPRLVPLLREAFESGAGRTVEILEGDALSLPFERRDSPYLLLSNLPYNISVPLLMKIIGGPSPPRQAVLMFQREVGERIVAPFGGKSYGSLSVAVSLLSHVTSLFAVRPGSFNPPPKVHSIVLSFRPREERTDPSVAGAITLARSAFGYRRKTLKNAFALGLPPDLHSLVSDLLRSDPGLLEKRPEQLPAETWVAMARRMIEHSPSIFDTMKRMTTQGDEA